MTPEKNPFAPPKASASIRSGEGHGAEGAGVWRQGKKLVMERTARLPNRCVKCGQPSAIFLERSIYWHPQAYYLFALVSIPIYLIVYAFVRRTAKIAVPLCERHNKRRRAGVWVLVGAFAALFAGIGVGVAAEAPAGPILGSLAFFICLILGLVWSSLMRPAKIDTEYVQAYVAPSFLEGLPHFPEDV
ncbi:MAG: hypothetical protein H6729_05650 [Deltaproteobacteria bacterium]|nr:hypothetical protein [Deltaproteobacteria bacterium]